MEPEPPVSGDHPAPTSAVARIWGCRELDAVFHGSDRVMLPWHRRTRGPLVPQLPPIRPGRPRLEPVDPRVLWATQPWVVRHHAAHYLSGVWERTGITSADMESAANRYPTISVDPDGRHIIRTGHHRSLAALIAGRPVLARVYPFAAEQSADGDPGDPEGARDLVVTAVLRVGSGSGGSPSGTEVRGVDECVAAIDAGRTVTVESVEFAAEVLAALGLDHDQTRDRLHMARTGRTILGR